jgi:hypothetical protein
MSHRDLLLLLAPIILIELALKVAALRDLARPERRVAGGNKLIWVLIVVLVSTIGPLAYFFAGRVQE